MHIIPFDPHKPCLINQVWIKDISFSDKKLSETITYEKDDYIFSTL